MNNRIPIKKHIKAMFFTITLFLLYYITHPLYLDVDNYMMSVVTNGLFDVDNYCIFMNPFQNWLIGMISGLLPSADGFALLCHIGWLTGFYLAFLSTDNIFCYLLLLGLSQIIGVWNANFTIQAAGFVLLGLLLIYGDHESKTRILIGTVLAGMGLLMRIQAGMLFLPFLGLHLLMFLYRRWQQKRASALSRTDIFSFTRKYLLLLLVFLAIFASRHYYRSIPKYEESVLYNIYRVKMEDYPVKSWNQITEEANKEGRVLKVTEEDYVNSVTWQLYDTDRMNVETLKELAEVSARFVDLKKEGALLPSYLAGTFLEGGYPLWIIVLVIILLSGCAFLQQDRLVKLEIAGILIGGFLIILAFTIIGRAPVRVWESILFAEVFGCWMVSHTHLLQLQKRFHAYFTAVSVCLLIGILLSFVSGYGIHLPQSALTARYGADDSHFKTYEENNQIAIHDNWHGLMEQYFMPQGKLPNPEFLEHNIAAGDWTYGQVYYQNYLKRLGIDNPAKALQSRSDVLYTAED